MVNKTAMSMLGYEAEQHVLGKHILHIIPHSRLLDVMKREEQNTTWKWK